MPTLFIHGEGNTGGRVIASTRWTCEVKDPRYAWNLHAREPGDPSLHYSRKWIAEEFFVRARQGWDEGRIWLDRESDSKVLSEVHGRILTRRETLRVSA